MYDLDFVGHSSNQLYQHLLRNCEIIDALDDFSQHLEESVKQRVQLTTLFCTKCYPNISPCGHSKIAILFSGGIDCSILALLADKYVKDSDSIDLINVSFEAPNSEITNWNVPDRETAKLSLAQLKELCPSRYLIKKSFVDLVKFIFFSENGISLR